MKIGFVVHFFDFRNDVRKVIDLISQTHQVVLFVRKADEKIIRQHAPEGVEIRLVDEYLPGLRNKLLDHGFRFFGKLPASRKNYYLMEYFKISLSNDTAKNRAYRLLNLAMKMPRVWSYDSYLRNIHYKARTLIQDIDEFICFTDISDSYLLARLMKEKKKIKIYVYSWDHPCKHVKYTHYARYLVWHEGLKQDMIELQGVQASQVAITGASQFGYIHQFLSLLPASSPYPFEYLYFGCAIGIPSLTIKEIEVIQRLSQWLTEMGSTLKLVVRPYPVLTNWTYYDNLKQLPNVVLDDQFRSKNMSVGEAQIMEKYNMIRHAKAFIHLGTTMGLEACFIDTPSLILDFPEFYENGAPLSLYNFVHQFQNDKYLMSAPAPNVVQSQDAFTAIVRQLEQDPDALLAYNRAVVQQIPLKSFEQFATDLVSA